MISPALGIVADDDTGGTDVAGMLRERGWRPLLVFDLPDVGRLARWSEGYDAVVMCVGTRSVEPELARERTRTAIERLRGVGCGDFYVKYCSTFDSTERGNIGPSLDAALDALGEPLTIVVPALPVNGRTTYMGYHFVGRQLLSDSPMRDHPLNPMRNPNLVDHLSRQTRRAVGLVDHPTVRGGAARVAAELERLRARGVAMAVVDCIDDGDLAAIVAGNAGAGLRLVSGGSGLAMRMRPPRAAGEAGSASAGGAARGADSRAGVLVIAGSCSQATRRQNQRFIDAGNGATALSAAEIRAGGEAAARAVSEAIAALGAGRDYLIAASAPPEVVAGIQREAAREGLTAEELGARIGHGLAEIARAILRAQSVAGLLIAGGETSGSLCRELGFGALAVGENIAPGVPLCFAREGFELPLVLKSGNFGGPDFYAQAGAAIRAAAAGHEAPPLL